MKSLLEKGSTCLCGARRQVGVDMPPLPDAVWNGVGLLLLTDLSAVAFTAKEDEPTPSGTFSETETTLSACDHAQAGWSIPENEPTTTTGEEPRNGTIRWYDPITGRWLSKDPIGIAGGLNQFVFANNNPVNFRDPLGLLSFGDIHRAAMSRGAALVPGVRHYAPLARAMTGLGRDPTAEEMAVALPAFGWGASYAANATLDGINPFGNPLESVYADECGNVSKDYLASRILGNISRLAYSARLTMGIREWGFNQLGSGYTYSQLPWGTRLGLTLGLRGEVLKAIGGPAVGGASDLLWTGSDIKGGWDLGSDIYDLFQ